MNTKELMQAINTKKFQEAKHTAEQSQDDFDFINMQVKKVSNFPDEELLKEFKKYIHSAEALEPNSFNEKMRYIVQNEIKKRKNNLILRLNKTELKSN